MKVADATRKGREKKDSERNFPGDNEMKHLKRKICFSKPITGKAIKTIQAHAHAHTHGLPPSFHRRKTLMAPS